METKTSVLKTCGQSLVQWISHQFFPEFKSLLQLAWPIILMNLFRLFNPTISMIMCGHLTKTEFDAASLANALINVFGVSVDLGFSTAFDTVFAQIHGSKNKRNLGFMLQRAVLVMVVIYLLLACFHLNIEPILIALKQDVEISRLTARYVTIYLPGLFFDFIFLAISRYLQSQNIVYPMMICSLVGCVFNVIFQYIAIYVIGFGIDASSTVQGLACFVMFFSQLLYVLISKVYLPTWEGFDFHNAIEGWGIFFRLGLPGIIMLGTEEWAFEIGNFLAGAISDIQLGAQSIAFQIEIICYMIHSGLAIASAIRGGQFLGSNNPTKASLAAKVVIITDLLISLTTITIILSLRKYLPYIFSNDKEIVELAESLLLIVASIHIFDAGASSAAGIFRACGRQLEGALVMFISFYVFGVPFGIILMFVVGMDIHGFWYGLLFGIALEALIYMVMIYRINWNREAEKAQILVKQSKIKGSNEVTEKTSLIDKRSDTEQEYDDNEDFDRSSEFRNITRIAGRRSIGSFADVSGESIRKILEISTSDTAKMTTIIRRSILCGTTLILFISSILIKVYLPRKYYVPCISNNQTSLPLDKHYPFCNDTMYN